MNKANLSSIGNYTVLQYRSAMIKFIAPYSLEYYESVKKWDHGYLVVMAKYAHNENAEEEYIDLNPILDTLLMDKEKFLSQIERVEVCYEESSEHCG